MPFYIYFVKYLKSYKIFETNFSDIFPKFKWVKLSTSDRENLKKEIWELVDNAYKPLGGHVRISDINKIVTDNELVFWNAIDVDSDPNIDVVIFARKTKFGYKISGWGHDNGTESKKYLLKRLISLLRKKGYWIEVSGNPAKLLSRNLKRLSIKDVRKLFPESEVVYLGNDLYQRTLEDGKKTEPEMILGNPNF